MEPALPMDDGPQEQAKDPTLPTLLAAPARTPPASEAGDSSSGASFGSGGNARIPTPHCARRRGAA